MDELPLHKTVSGHFLGRMVTVITAATTLPVKTAVDHSQYFTGEMVHCDQHGVYLKHPVAGTLAFFTFPLLGIVEEQYIPKDDPRYKQVEEVAAKQAEAATKKPGRVSPAGQQFIDINALKATLPKK